MSKSKLLAVILALSHLTCAAVPLTAPSGTSLTLNANPEFVPANGGTSAITAVLVEPAGTFVPDGTEVFFLTNLGHIEAEAKTKNGLAHATFVSDSRSGRATITAFSGGPATTPSSAPSPSPTPTPAALGKAGVSAAASSGPVVLAGVNTATAFIDIGSALPATVTVTADPPRITEPRNSLITANVFDEHGNPVANVPVIFTVTVQSGRLLQESLDSGGQPRYTDTNGQARDTLRTSQNRADAQKQVNVVATIPGISIASPVAPVFIN
jgi:hypothetical protein